MGLERFHYHITIEGVSSEQLKEIAKTVRAKATVIDLEGNGNKQRDRVITRYAGTKRLCMEFAKNDRRAIQDMGFKVVRIKVEKEGMELGLELGRCRYLECHVKVQDTGDLKEIPGFHKSLNPNEQGTRFYTARLYSLKDLENYQKALTGIPNIIKVQEEAVLIDSNYKLDEWWAGKAA